MDMKIYCVPHDGKNGSETVYKLLEHAFRTEYGAALPEIKKTPSGKPFFPLRPDVHFSLSHSKTHVLCAVSRAPVGVDIEAPRRISERAVKYFCSPEELRLFDPLDLWVLKESYIKLVGLTLPAVKTLRFSRQGDTIIAPDESAASKLYSIGDCRAAVSTFGGELPESVALFDRSLVSL